MKSALIASVFALAAYAAPTADCTTEANANNGPYATGNSKPATTTPYSHTKPTEPAYNHDAVNSATTTTSAYAAETDCDDEDVEDATTTTPYSHAKPTEVYGHDGAKDKTTTPYSNAKPTEVYGHDGAKDATTTQPYSAAKPTDCDEEKEKEKPKPVVEYESDNTKPAPSPEVNPTPSGDNYEAGGLYPTGAYDDMKPSSAKSLSIGAFAFVAALFL
jgi:hypothetical protein